MQLPRPAAGLFRAAICAIVCAVAHPAIAQTPIPYVVRDLFTSPTTIGGNYQPSKVVECNGRAYFAAASSVNGWELFSTDGTDAGTRLVRDINPGLNDSLPQDLIAYNGRVYFSADDGVHGREVWVSDGTPTGTSMLADLKAGFQSSEPKDFSIIQGKLVFSATGYRVFDGTTLTTLELSGACCLYNGSCAFVTYNACTAQGGMWGGTEVACQSAACNQPVSVSCCLPNKSCVYLAATPCAAAGGTPNAPNTLCGTCVGPDMVVCCLAGGACSMLTPQDCSAAGGSQRFLTTSCSPSPCGTAPQVCCLPSQQCFLVSASAECTSRSGVIQAASRVCAAPGTTQTYCAQSTTFPCCRPTGVCTVASGATCLISYSGWLRPSGQTCAATPCLQVGEISSIDRVFSAGSRIVQFGRTSATSQVVLWGSDTLTGSRQFLGMIPTVLAPSSNTNPIGCGSRVYFGVGFSPNYQLWTSDGTPQGTFQITWLGSNKWSGNAAAGPDGVLYFYALDANGAYQLWRTDATSQGTYALTAFPFGSSYIRDTSYFSGVLIFNMALPQQSRRLWRLSDPPATGEPVQLTPSTVTLTESAYFAALGPTMYFSPGTGSNLWKTDGTPGGTAQVFPIPLSTPATSPPDPRRWSGLDPTNLSVANGQLFFSGVAPPGSSPAGKVLWISDGTLDATSVVSYLDGSQNSSLGEMCAGSGQDLYFAAHRADTGIELFKTDGSVDGTYLVKDIYPGTTGAIPNRMVFANNTLLFNASISGSPSSTGGILFRSDGTTQGTAPIGTLDGIASGGSRAVELTSYAGRLFYFDRSSGSGYELWNTDGTPGNEALFFEAVPGPADGFLASENPATAVHGGLLYFRAKSGLYRTDGTIAGTVQLFATDPTQNTTISRLYPTALGMHFTALGSLWKTDGTLAGTQRLVPNNVAPMGVFDVVDAGGNLFFFGGSGTAARSLWTGDGTSGGSTAVAPVTIDSSTTTLNMRAFGNRVYYFTGGGSAGPDWMTSDGTPAGTRLALDPAQFPYRVGSATVALNRLLLTTMNVAGSSGGLWAWDGAAAPPVRLTPNVSNVFIQGITPAGNYVYFMLYDGSSFKAVYRTDGTPQGTVELTTFDPLLVDGLHISANATGDLGDDMVFTVTPPNYKCRVYRTRAPNLGVELVTETGYSEEPRFFTRLGTRSCFYAASFLTGAQIFATDGTPAGTLPITSVNSAIGALVVNSVVPRTDGFFACTDYRVYITDGTTSGTRRVVDFASNGSPTIPSAGFAVLNESLYFMGRSPATGGELWRSDGTPAGTAMVGDLTPGTDGTPVNRITQGVNRFLFGAEFPPTLNFGQEPCISDGTAVGTRVIADVRSGTSSSNPRSFFDAGTFALFTADAGAGAGRELYRTDGSSAGTALLKDIYPGSTSSDPQGLVRIGSLVYFTADDGSRGRELWRTDGTAAGTVLVRDICPGPLGANPQWLTAAGARIYFTAYTPETGVELWASDGTATGTIRLFEIVPGPSSANIRNLTRAGDRLYFLATVPPKKPSLWSFDWVGGLAYLCQGDYDRSASLTIDDFFLYIQDWFTNVPLADMNADGTLSIDDLFLYFNAYLSGC